MSMLPDAFIKRIREQLGDDAALFLKAMDEPSVRGIRMNPLRSAEVFRDAAERIPWQEDAWYLGKDSEAGTTIAHEAGAFYLQEPSAMIPAAVMRARPGERILDLCSAPGGKATQMGCDMRGDGLLICNEPVGKRAAILSRNIERMGIPNAVVTSALPEQLSRSWKEVFDGVLVDAPCSGEGMFRRLPESRVEWTAEKADGCAQRQHGILSEAAKMVRPGGRLVYSTCTYNPAENEQQVERFLNENPAFRAEEFFLPGMEKPSVMWTVWPHKVCGEGQFAALFRKGGNDRKTLKSEFSAPDRTVMNVWRESRTGTPEPNAVFGHTLVRVPETPETRGIRVMRPGLQIGEVKGRYFVPDHAAAVAFFPPETERVPLSDGEACRYLAGEAIAGDAKGWVLMTWQGLVLGWGKGSDGMIRNHYPKGLRNGLIKA